MDKNTQYFKELLEKNLISREQFEELSSELESEKSEQNDKSKLNRVRQELGDEEALENVAPEEVTKKLTDHAAKFGKYVKILELGRGGVGIVFKAYDTTLKRFVALKILNIVFDDSVKRFKREAEIIAKLSHLNIVPVFEIGEYEGKHYISMQLVEGETLDKLINSLNVEESIQIIRKVCDAVEYAHSMGIIHRDIKPHNIMIGRNNSVYILDFGIAREVNSALTKTDLIIGTPQYMAPEQIDGSGADERTDIYSIGATLYHCLAKTSPFSGTSALEILSKISESDPVSPRTIDKQITKDLETIIQKCLRKEQDLRYQSVRELSNDIDKFLNGEPIITKGLTIWYPLLRRIKKHRVAVIVTSAFLIIGIPSIVMLINKARTEAQVKGATELLSKRQQAIPHFEKGRTLYEIAMRANSEEDRKAIGQNLSNAFREFTKAIEIDETFAEAYVARGTTSFTATRYNDAISDFKTATEKNPKLSDAYFMRSLSYFAIVEFRPIRNETMDELNKAIEVANKDLGKLTELNALPGKIKCIRGIIGYMERNLEEAVNMFNEAVQDDPSLVYAHFLRGYIASKISLRSQLKEQKIAYANTALANFNRAIELQNNFAPAYAQAWLMATVADKYQLALNYLGNARQMLPWNTNLLIYEAKTHLLFGYRDEAIKTLNDSKQMDENSDTSNRINLLINRGELYLGLGMNEEAEADFEQALELSDEKNREKLAKEIERLKRITK